MRCKLVFQFGGSLALAFAIVILRSFVCYFYSQVILSLVRMNHGKVFGFIECMRPYIPDNRNDGPEHHRQIKQEKVICSCISQGLV